MKRTKKQKRNTNEPFAPYVILNAKPLRKLNDEFPELMTEFEDFPVYVSDACWQQITNHPKMTAAAHVLDIMRSWAYSKLESVAPGINAIDPYFYMAEMGDGPSDGLLIFPALSFFRGTQDEFERKMKDGTLKKELQERFDAMPDFWFPSEQLGYHQNEGGTVR